MVQQGKSDARREEYFADFKEELEGLNIKIEEVEWQLHCTPNNLLCQVLDSVGMTIQEKLKETNSDIQLKLAQDAQETQNQRAEIDFDISGLKERMETLDQGLNEVIYLVSYFPYFTQVNEKVYEFEQNKRNNLIFYGLTNEARETPEILISKIQTIIRVTLKIRRDINLTKVRLY